MSEKPVGTLLLAVLLGCVSGYILPKEVGAFGVFITYSFIWPLAIGLLSKQRNILLGVVPHLATILWLAGYALLPPYIDGLDEEILINAGMILVSAHIALVILLSIYWVRRRKRIFGSIY